jgi:hypothetical protein
MTPDILEVLKWQPKLFEFTWFDIGVFTRARRNSMIDEVNRQQASGELCMPLYSDQQPKDLPLPFNMFGIVFKTDHADALLMAITFDLKGNDLHIIFRHPTGKVLEMTQMGDKSAVNELDMLYDGALMDSLKKAPRWAGRTDADIVGEFTDIAREVYWLLMIEVIAYKKAIPSYKPIPNPTNDKRIRKGKKPLFEWKVIDVTAKHVMPENSAPTGRKQASPRRHVRRGHQRMLPNGKKIWIKQMMVGKIEFGYIHHSYTNQGEMK